LEFLFSNTPLIQHSIDVLSSAESWRAPFQGLTKAKSFASGFFTLKKEGIMAVKILIKRKFKEGNLKMAARLLINHRNGAMQQPGYISSETMQRLEDPFQITVVSMWKDIEAWEAWKNSETRLANENEAKGYLVGQIEYEHYSLGLPLE
jgi:heme-degrading monooxygenase HmoA